MAARPCKGYIVTLEGDTQRVFIRVTQMVRERQREVTVVDSEDRKIRVYGAAELRAYGYWIKS